MKQAQSAPRPRGRPPGSKTKPPELPLPKEQKNDRRPGEEKKMIDDLPTEPAYEADSPFRPKR